MVIKSVSTDKYNICQCYFNGQKLEHKSILICVWYWGKKWLEYSEPELCETATFVVCENCSFSVLFLIIIYFDIVE